MSGYTRQKVSAAIRKAGLSTARWNASGQVRGWGDWSSGVRVTEDKYDGVIRLHWQTGRWSKLSDKQLHAYGDKIAAALTAAGVVYTRGGLDAFNVEMVKS